MGNKQKGFSFLEILIALIVLSIVAFCANYFLTRNSEPTAKEPTISSNSNDDDKNNFEISEWGVFANVPASGIEYSIIDNSEGDQIAQFNSTDLKKIEFCSAPGSGGSIIRHSEDTKPEDNSVRKVGNYYYGFLFGNGSCAGSDISAQNTEDSVKSTVEQILNSLEEL